MWLEIEWQSNKGRIAKSHLLIFSFISLHMFINTNKLLLERTSNQFWQTVCKVKGRCFQSSDISLTTSSGNDITLEVYLRLLSCRLVELIFPSIVSTLLSKRSKETSWSSISDCNPRPRFFSLPRPNDISSGQKRHTNTDLLESVKSVIKICTDFISHQGFCLAVDGQIAGVCFWDIRSDRTAHYPETQKLQILFEQTIVLWFW